MVTVKDLEEELKDLRARNADLMARVEELERKLETQKELITSLVKKNLKDETLKSTVMDLLGKKEEK